MQIANKRHLGALEKASLALVLISCDGEFAAASPDPTDGIPEEIVGAAEDEDFAADSAEARLEFCVPNPVDDTPQCCPRGSIVRPGLNMCTKASDLSPRIDIRGFYRGENDPNAATLVSNTLQVCAVHVIDNGEGATGIHGPFGHLYIDIFPPTEPLAYSHDGADKRRIRDPRRLRGPHRTHDDDDEWLDDEAMVYMNYGIHVFNINEGPAADRVVMRVWESDSQSEDGSWGRRNDVLGMELIDRALTAQGPRWVDFHAYTNDHPRVRTQRVALRMLLQTGGTCPLQY